MRRLLAVLLLLPAFGSAACVTGHAVASPYGRRVEVFPSRAAGRRPPSITGELLAVSAESLWVFRDNTIATVPLAQVDAVRVARHGFTPGKAMAWSLVGGLVSGVALTAACGSVEGAECGAVLPGVILSWGLVGGLSAATLSGSSSQRLAPEEWERLRPFARFPQGLPEGFPRRP